MSHLQIQLTHKNTSIIFLCKNFKLFINIDHSGVSIKYMNTQLKKIRCVTTTRLPLRLYGVHFSLLLLTEDSFSQSGESS